MKPGLRRRLTLLVTLVALFTVGALTAGVNLALRSSLDDDASKLLQGRVEAAAEAIRIEDGRMRLHEGADEPALDAQVWVLAGGRVLETPETATSDETQMAKRLAASGAGELDDDATDLRYGALPIRAADGTKVGTLVTAISLEPYERTQERTLLISALFAAVVVAAMGIATWIVVGRALQPVARMTANAADWSAHDLDRRFRAGEPTDELTRLAATFDDLLDRVAAALRHEKRLSAEISHELRTPLAAVAAEAELTLRHERTGVEYREALEQISRRAGELTEIVETLLLAAREDASSVSATTDLRQPVNDATDAIEKFAEACGVAVDATVPSDPVIANVEAAGLRRLLGPVLENACAYARSSVAVWLTADRSDAVITIVDDGQGVDESEREAIFDPGARGNAPRNTAAPDGTGLGLALARRLARALGGEIRAMPAEAGARFEIRLPLSG